MRSCFSVEQMSKQLGIGRSAAFNLVHQTDFYPAFRIGKRILVDAQALDRWIYERTEGERGGGRNA